MAERILVAEDDALVARLVQQTFQKAGYVVEVVADGKTARDRLHRGGYRALITDWMMPELDGIELVRFIRSRGEPCYVALVTELNIPAAQAHALQQGADAFFVKPFVPAQLLHSLTEWFDRMRAGTLEPPTVGASKTVVAELPHPIAQTSAWKGLHRSLRQVIADTLQLPLDVAPAWERPLAGCVVSLLRTVDVEHLIDLHVWIETPRASAAEIARTLLGDAEVVDCQTLDDIVAEFGNIAAGCVKANFSREGFVFTLGIATMTESRPPYSLAMALGLRTQGIELVVRVGVRPRNSVRRAVVDLREGMVLADNVYSRLGGLLLPAGTRLTATAADVLRGALIDVQVRVCLPDLSLSDEDGCST